MKKLIDVMTRAEIDECLRYEYHITTCPCCGNETFDMYFICPHCGWEYDGTQNNHEYSSANKSTLLEYRLRFNAKRG